FTSVVAFFVSFSVTLSRSIGACTDKITSLSLHDALPILAFCPIPRCSRRSPAKRIRREEEEQGNERSYRRQAETEWSGLCDDEPPWAKELAARRRRNSPAQNELIPNPASPSWKCISIKKPSNARNKRSFIMKNSEK